jgi:hypothetical protein
VSRAVAYLPAGLKYEPPSKYPEIETVGFAGFSSTSNLSPFDNTSREVRAENEFDITGERKSLGKSGEVWKSLGKSSRSYDFSRLFWTFLDFPRLFQTQFFGTK